MPKGRPGSPRLLFLSPHCRRDVASSVWDIWPSKHSSCRGARWGLILLNRRGRKLGRRLAWLNCKGGCRRHLIRLSGGGCSCTSFSSTVGGLSGSTVVSGAADTLFGSTAAGCASFSSTAGALSGSTEEAGAGDILFASAAAAAGCASFGSTAGVLFCSSAAAGSSAGVFVSCAGRGRGSGGDDTIRWRCAPVPVTWWNQVITLCATLETGGRALGGVGGCGPCAWADVAANNWRDRERCGPQHSRPHGRPSRSTQQ
jgi:hypothetical protein